MIHNLHPDLIASLRSSPHADRVLQRMLQVRVMGVGAQEGQDLPNVFGRHQVLESGIRFIPHFPFESGIRFRATFDPRSLGRPEFSEVLSLEFACPREKSAARTHVKQVFPSSESLPQNLLRFYVCFSNPMQRGRVEEQVALLGSDGHPMPDMLYRPPVELWDRTMRYLTILLDPGRLKRGVGPNRELGPPLKVGQEYTLAIGSGMVDSSGCPLRESFSKAFHCTEANRERIAMDEWAILRPATNSHQPLVLRFPKPLDWALLWQAITVIPKNGHPMDGRMTIDQGERQWSFTPTSPWTAGSYYLRIGSSLEDVCGNSLLGAFDRPLGLVNGSAHELRNRSIPFQLI